MKSLFSLLLTSVSMILLGSAAWASDAPSIIDYYPSNGANDVPVDTLVDVQVDQFLGPECVISFELRTGGESGLIVPSDLEIVHTKVGSQLFIAPRQPLIPGLLYYAIFEYRGDDREEDEEDEENDEDRVLHVWNFSTVPASGETGMLLIEPKPVDFGNVISNTTKGIQVLVKSIGTAPVDITLVDTPVSVWFALTQENCSGATLVTNASCLISIEFTPSYIGAFSDILTIQTSIGPVEIKLNGKGFSEPNFSLTESSRYPTRLAQGPDGNIYISDFKQGVVHIVSRDLELVGRIRGLVRPLGVTVSAQGLIYVGSKGRKSVEAYDSGGIFQFNIDAGNILMPNAMAFGPHGNLHVVDSLGNIVKVYSPDGLFLYAYGGAGTGAGELLFPSAIAISPLTNEIFVADQGHFNVKVYDLNGTYLRSIGRRVSSFGTFWQGRFASIQAIAVDLSGRIHVLDSYQNRVQILDPVTKTFLGSYGQFGTQPGDINLGLDLLIMDTGDVVVSNAENHRLELFPLVTLP